jgi:hypothetical protein
MSESNGPTIFPRPPHGSQHLIQSRSWKSLWAWLAMAVVLGVTAYQLHNQGRQWWCECGQWDLWSGDVWSRHNSQHLFDPYSFTHVLHGLIYSGILAWLCPRVAPSWRLWLAITIAALWETLENSDFIIQRYRAATISLVYTGDTIANSLGDILSCGLGFVLARRLGLWRSVALFLVTEIVLILWIRDSLILNIVMLLHPIETLKGWQVERLQ